MNLTRCENGHFYDAERFETCPHCNQTVISTAMHDENGATLYTVPLPADGAPKGGDPSDGAQNTIGYYGEEQPVVGWLVCVEGVHYGKDFRLKAGRNFIGRAVTMDVCLSGEASISREKHAIILYEPKSNVFLVQPGDAKELFYLNDNVVLSATEINAYDVLSLGDTKLLFIPCCSDKFKWEKKEKEEDKEKETEKK